ncbi:MAG TPA: hypothetical protein EYP17_08825 [Candidatus Latescibacteria bacterium]|nr:hypothetical protein [Candidatus Latescibacterota bacterium]
MSRRKGSGTWRCSSGMCGRRRSRSDGLKASAQARGPLREEFGEQEGCHFAVDNHGLITNDAELHIEAFRRVGSDLVGQPGHHELPVVRPQLGDCTQVLRI